MENNASTGERTALLEREHISPSHEFARRILIGAAKRDAFNPNIPLAPVTREALGTFATRDYTVFNTRSQEERKAHGADMETWLTNTQTLFTNSKEFFTADEKGRQWAEVYKRLGLSTDHVDRKSLQQFYAKYLGATDGKDGGVKQFVKDVLSAPEYQHDLPAISWIAHVFGENSAQVISRLSAAEGMLEENPDELINDTDTTLSNHEKKVLEFLHTEKVVEPKSPPAKPPEPKTAEARAETTKAEETYKKYFGENWKEKLKKALLIDVRQATEEDREREKKNGAIGLVGTHAEVGPTNELVANHIVIFNESAAGDYELRTEIGEAMWNILENTAVTKKVPHAEAFQAKAERTTPELVVQFSTQLLDMWDSTYTTQPTRYSGLTGKPREYKDIPEWKSEGFADGIAIEIKRKAGLPLDVREQDVWNSFTAECKAVLALAGQMLPDASFSPSKTTEKVHAETPKAPDTPSHKDTTPTSHAKEGHHDPTTHEIDPNKDLLPQVNEALKTETANKIRFTATEATLKKYLKTLSVKDYKLDESDAVIKTTNGEHSLVVSGKVNVTFGSAAFTATLENNPAGGVTVKTHTLDLKGLANFARGDIEKYITNLDEKIVEQINDKVDKAWGVSNMKIGEDTLEMEFKKK